MGLLTDKLFLEKLEKEDFFVSSCFIRLSLTTSSTLVDSVFLFYMGELLRMGFSMSQLVSLLKWPVSPLREMFLGVYLISGL